MKPRVLKELLESVKSPSHIELKSYRLARASFWVSLLAIPLTIISIITGVYFVQKQIDVSPEKEQMQRLINKTEDLIDKNTKLAALSQIQIDSLVSINKKLSKQADIARDQYNMNAQLNANANRKELVDKYMAYNKINYAFVDMHSILAYHKLKRLGKINLHAVYIDKRIEALSSIHNSLRTIKNIAYLIENATIVKQFSDCGTSIMEYKQKCYYYKAIAGNIDTSEKGQREYDEVMYKVLDLEDSLLPAIDIYRLETQKRIDTVIQIMKYNETLFHNENPLPNKKSNR